MRRNTMFRKWMNRALSMIICLAVGFMTVPAHAENNDGFEYVIKDGNAVIIDYTGTEKEINIPDTINGYPVTKIGDRAFEGMDITDVTIPSGVTVIGSLAFGNCTSLKYMKIDAVNIADKDGNASTGWSSDDHFAVFFNAGSPDGFEVVFGDGVYKIPAYLFATADEEKAEGVYCKISKVTIPASVMKIGMGAFINCYDLKEVIYDGPKSEWEGFITQYNVGYHNWYFLNQGTVTFLQNEPAPTPTPTPEPTPTPTPTPVPVKAIAMHRLYNPNSYEHFYTGNAKEKDVLVSIGWKYEGIGWYAPETSNTPVYRLYNPNNGGDHHYTKNKKEYDALVKAGWIGEDIRWFSDDKETVPVYREYNTGLAIRNHNYTANKKEHDALISFGWKDEGIGWYGVK